MLALGSPRILRIPPFPLTLKQVVSQSLFIKALVTYPEWLTHVHNTPSLKDYLGHPLTDVRQAVLNLTL